MMMKLRKVFSILWYSCLLMFTLLSPSTKWNVSAQGFPTLTPSLLEIGCSDPSTICSYDSSRPTRFFVFVEPSNELWVYSAPNWTGVLLDLSDARGMLGTSYLLDFVAISETELLFIGTRREDGKNHLTIVDTTTGQVQDAPINFDGISLDSCDSIPSRPIDSLWAFPNSSRVLVCGIGEDGMRKLVIANIATSQIERIISIPPSRGNQALNPWLKVLIGLDGNVYVAGLEQNAYEYIFPNTTQPEDSVDLSRYDPTTGNWRSESLPLDAIVTNLQTNENFLLGASEPVAIDVNGNIYYLSQLPRQNGESVKLMTVFDSSGELETQLPVDALVNAGVFMFQSADGELVFQNFSSSPSQLSEVDPVDYLPTPTATPALTATPTPTSTPSHEATATPTVTTTGFVLRNPVLTGLEVYSVGG